MTATVYPFAEDDEETVEVEIPIEDAPDPELEIEIEPEPEPAPAAVVVAPAALMQVLPADFPLPVLTRFVPDVGLKVAADEATAYALAIDVKEAEGLKRADVALTALRGSLRKITESFAEPAAVADRLHKWITVRRGEWLAQGEAAVKTIGARIYVEQTRLSAIAADARRKAQEEADRIAREQAQREADAAAQAKAPAPIVEELKRQAATATAPPVQVASSAPVLTGNTTTKTWKARLAGTPADLEPNPKMAELSVPQLVQVRVLLQAILEDKAPITSLELNWTVLNRRAVSDKTTLSIPGIEAFESGGVRAKGRRA